MYIFVVQGCSSPLVVKFADTQKDKDQKKLQQIQSNIWNMAAGMNFSPQSYLATAALSQQFATNGVSIFFSYRTFEYFNVLFIFQCVYV